MRYSRDTYGSKLIQLTDDVQVILYLHILERSEAMSARAIPIPYKYETESYHWDYNEGFGLRFYLGLVALPFYRFKGSEHNFPFTDAEEMTAEEREFLSEHRREIYTACDEFREEQRPYILKNGTLRAQYELSGALPTGAVPAYPGSELQPA